MKKLFLFIVFVFFLAVFESGFMPHTPFFINLVIIYALLFNIIESPEKENGLIVAGIGGFLFDVFTPHFFGVYTISFIACALLIKLLLRKYVRFPEIFSF